MCLYQVVKTSTAIRKKQFLFLIICVAIIRICSSTTESEESRIKSNIHKPRYERLKNRTSGEEAWLHSLKDQSSNADASSKSSDHRAKRINRDTERSTRISSEGEAYTYQEKGGDTSILTGELLRLSQPHGLDPTASVDRATFAELLNTANSENNDAVASMSTLNTAYYFLGLFYLYGLAGMKEADIDKAVEWFQRAAENGHGDAQCSLGLLLYYGIDGSIGKDKKSAMRWFYRASSDSNHPRAHWLLGKTIYEGMFYDDIGISDFNREDPNYHNSSNDSLPFDPRSKQARNFLEAARLFQKAANHELPEAIHQLGIMYEYGLVSNYAYNGNAVNKERFEQAIQHYKRAADLGYVESLYNIALMYAYGRGVPQNYAKAADYFRRGAMNNHSPSMRFLGIFAMNGYDQTDEMPNTKLALYWFEKCVRYSMNSQFNNVMDLCTTELNETKLIVDKIRSYQSEVLR